jgi:hypothetical protein
MRAPHPKALCSDGVVSPQVCDRTVVPHRRVMHAWWNPEELAVDARRAAAARARWAARVVDGGVVYVPRALHRVPRAPCMPAQRIAQFSHSYARNCIPLMTLRRNLP